MASPAANTPTNRFGTALINAVLRTWCLVLQASECTTSGYFLSIIVQSTSSLQTQRAPFSQQLPCTSAAAAS
jgi:hypothetical protein